MQTTLCAFGGGAGGSRGLGAFSMRRNNIGLATIIEGDSWVGPGAYDVSVGVFERCWRGENNLFSSWVTTASLPELFLHQHDE